MQPEGETEEMLRENELNYVDGSQGPSGPFKYLTKEQKEKVHMEIDIRMQELEDTGLRRSEILFEKSYGPLLSDDPFFQFVKNS